MKRVIHVSETKTKHINLFSIPIWQFQYQCSQNMGLNTTLLKCTISWNTTPCSVVEIYRHYVLFQIEVKYSGPK
jgi:hypothetical protein